MAIIESDLVKLYHELGINSRKLFDILNPLDTESLFPVSVTRWSSKNDTLRVISTENKYPYLLGLQNRLLNQVSDRPASATFYYLLETLLNDTFNRGNKILPIIIMADEGPEGNLLSIEKFSSQFDYKRALRRLKETKPRRISGLEFLQSSAFEGTYTDNGSTAHIIY